MDSCSDGQLRNPSTGSPTELARQVCAAATKRERIAALARMSPDERLAAFRRSEWDFDACCLWASLYRHEVPLLNGEFEFIARTMPEVCDVPSPRRSTRPPQR